MKRRTRGFTLVEMVVATIVLAVGAVAAMMAISSSMRAVSEAESYSRAALLTEMRFSELEADPTSLTSGEQQGDFGTDYPGFQWIQTVDRTDLQDVVRVTLTITWTSGRRQGSATFVTMLQTGTGG